MILIVIDFNLRIGPPMYKFLATPLDATLSIMIIISWNYCGLGNQCAVGALTKLVRKKGSTVFFLMETKWSIA